MKRVVVIFTITLLLSITVFLAKPAYATTTSACGSNNSARIYYLNNGVLWCQGFSGYGYLGVSVNNVENVTAYAQLWMKVYTPGFQQGLYCYIPAGHNVNVNNGQVHQIDPGGNAYGYCPNPIN